MPCTVNALHLKVLTKFEEVESEMVLRDFVREHVAPRLIPEPSQRPCQGPKYALGRGCKSSYSKVQDLSLIHI